MNFRLHTNVPIVMKRHSIYEKSTLVHEPKLLLFLFYFKKVSSFLNELSYFSRSSKKYIIYCIYDILYDVNDTSD